MDTIWSSLQSFAESSVNFANLYNYVLRCLKTSFILFIGQQLYIQLIDIS